MTMKFPVTFEKKETKIGAILKTTLFAQLYVRVDILLTCGKD